MATATAPPWETVVEGGPHAPDLAVRGRDGAGAPLVLVHGLGGTVEEWEPLADRLAPRRPVYAFDLRGHGRSADGAWTVEGHMADLGRVLDRLDLRAPVVAGHGFGGLVATLFASRHGGASAAVGIDAYGWPRPGVVAERLGLGPDEAAANVGAARAFVLDQFAAACSPMPAEVFERQLASFRAGAFGLPGPVLEAMALRAALRDDRLVSLRPGPRAVRALCADLDRYDTDAPARALPVPALALVTCRPLPPIPGAPARFSAMLAAQAAHELAAPRPRRTVRALDAPPPAHVTRPAAVAEAIESFLEGIAG
ncbi:alpha/beta hydrolase [Streptomonospora sp. PA3]|uniref:alpha/beta fold hydrolase n=1 Tax=Streptomonospora sp. PA3 TaxID=2607326 RepID=UPI0012DFD768|nr:alpha/beta hydrolase [Streptomonospora sp. PA3]MUL42269.1 alpha/beta hydrolase [Streptomonospora sp. PA3]